MLPLTALQNLTPLAAKIYLTLQSLAGTSPVARAPIPTLATHSTLSPRSCKRALAQLRALHLIYRLPRRYHQPNAFILVPEYVKQKDLQTKGPPVAPPPPTNRPPMAPHPAQTRPNTLQPTPATPAKTQMGPPLAPLLNNRPGSATQATPDTLLRQLLAEIAAAPRHNSALSPQHSKLPKPAVTIAP